MSRVPPLKMQRVKFSSPPKKGVESPPKIIWVGVGRGGGVRVIPPMF